MKKSYSGRPRRAGMIGERHHTYGLADEVQTTIKDASGVYAHLRNYAYEEKEHVLVIALRTNSTVINTHLVSVGTINQSLVHPREVLRPVLLDNAASMILVHNHPTGDVNPSRADETITRRIADAGELMGIELLDHVIIGHDKHYSFRDEREL